MASKRSAELLRTEEAARCLGISKRQLQRLVAVGTITIVRIGRRVLVPREVLDAYVRALIRGGPAEPEEAHGERPEPQPGGLLSVDDLSTEWRVSSALVRKLVRSGELTCLRIGTRILIATDEAAAFLSKRTKLKGEAFRPRGTLLGGQE